MSPQDVAPCPDCGAPDGGRYKDELGDGLVCWPCLQKRRESLRTAETIDRLNGISYAGGNGHDSSAGRQLVLTVMADVKPESVRWAWRNRIVLGMLNVIVGEPGLGKSTLVYDVAAKMSRGELDGDLYLRPANVLIVTYEDHIASVVRPRLEMAGADLERVHEIAVKQDDSEDLLTLPNDIELIRQAIDRTQARLLTVDPIVASLPGEINSHRDQDVRRVLAPLSQLAEHHGLAVVVVMHVNKSAAKQFFQRVGASVGFTGAARSMLLVARDPEDPDGERGLRRVLAHGKCNVGRLAPSVLFEIEAVTTDSGVETSRLGWLGECETTTADLLGDDSGDERLEIDEACDFLIGELGAERRPEEEIRAAALARGFSEATFRRARKRLGVQSKREGFGSEGRWFLEFPDVPLHRRSSPDEDDSVSAYGETPDLRGQVPSKSAPNPHRRSTVRDERLWSGPDQLVEQIKSVFAATEIGEDEWAELAIATDIETWDLRSPAGSVG